MYRFLLFHCIFLSLNRASPIDSDTILSPQFVDNPSSTQYAQAPASIIEDFSMTDSAGCDSDASVDHPLDEIVSTSQTNLIRRATGACPVTGSSNIFKPGKAPSQADVAPAASSSDDDQCTTPGFSKLNTCTGPEVEPSWAGIPWVMNCIRGKYFFKPKKKNAQSMKIGAHPWVARRRPWKKRGPVAQYCCRSSPGPVSSVHSRSIESAIDVKVGARLQSQYVPETECGAYQIMDFSRPNRFSP